MTFYALGAALCLSVLFIVLAGASILGFLARRILPFASRVAQVWLRHARPGEAANLLFFLMALPLFLACGVTLGLALPAFLKFEPYSTRETMGPKLLAFAAAGALVVLWMAARAARVAWVTRRTARRWESCATGMRIEIHGRSVSFYRVESNSSLLALTGIWRPKIFVAESVARILSHDELSAALAHELAHLRAQDNLKQFMLAVTQPPRWLGLSSLLNRSRITA